MSYRVIRPLLGGRSANPYDYFTGATDFNSDLFESPLLAIDDEEATNRDETKQKFLARVKSFVVNPSHAYHPKFLDRVSIEWTGRIVVTLNEDPSSTGLLPEVNSNTEDKLCFFASRPYLGTWDDREVIEATIEAELPFFAAWLLQWQPPHEVLASGRMGVKSYFDPRILELSKQQVFAYNLQELITMWCDCGVYWTDLAQREFWEGTPTALLTEFSIVEHFRQALLDWNVNKVAKSLSQLARQNNAGVKVVEGGSERLFRISRPHANGAQEKGLV